MITLLTGENSFEKERELARTIRDARVEAEKVDGEELGLKQLPDLLMGGSLFAARRLVILKNLSENKPLWAKLEDWLGRMPDEIHLVLVEAKPDKRTKTYKELQKLADVREFKPWGERDVGIAESWAIEEASRQGFLLDKKSAQVLVRRTGVDQWAVFHALEKLSVVGEVTPAIIEELIDLSPTGNVFAVFETALRGDAAALHRMLATLELGEDPYRLFGLLSSQAFQLAALAVAEKSSSEVAHDLGAHPFVLSKLTPFAKKLGRAGAKKVVAAFAEADTGLKTSAAEPWLLIERALMKVANI